ncbi:MAG: DUF177 domain-containing protein [Elusimicrobia bacterium]|nr:DUF177 domain-containing protein [Elusimicrobiota bacterium]
MSAALVFPLTEVKEKGFVSVDVAVPAADFPGILVEGELKGPISVKGSISQQDDEAVFDGNARGKWVTECTRCLTPVEGDFDAPVEQRSPIDGGPLDLSDEVRQSVVLAQPMKTYCKPDCRGFCSVCRKNRNLGDCGHAQGGAESSTRPRLTPRPDKG